MRAPQIDSRPLSEKADDSQAQLHAIRRVTLRTFGRRGLGDPISTQRRLCEPAVSEPE